MKPRFEKPYANWASHSDFDYEHEDMVTSPPPAPPSSSFPLIMIAVLLVTFGMGAMAWGSYKEEERYKAEARAEIMQYRDSDPRRALSVYCREAKTEDERLMYCR